MMMMMMMMQLQVQAALLRDVMSGGEPTKIVALGITDGVDVDELRHMASPPQNKTVILVEDFSNLGTVEDQLLGEICIGKQVVK